MAGQILFVWIIVVGCYFVVPIGSTSTIRTTASVAVDAALVVGVIYWQARRIARAEYPEIRAMEALGTILGFFLVLFASIYRTMSHSSPKAFTQPRDHMRALYFTNTAFSTVGFGDITATTDAGRGVVSVQMVIDLVLIGAVVRLLITGAKTSLKRPPEA
jgi:voltage-gated potassium channel